MFFKTKLMSLVEYIPTVSSRDHRNNIESAVRAINISNKHKTANACKHKGLFKRIQHCWTNIIQQCYYNRYDCFSFKSFWLDKLYSNSKPSLDKNI